MAKIDKLLVLADKFLTVKGHADELSKVASIIGKSRRVPGQFHTNNENMAALRTLAIDWRKTLGDTSQHDINWWLEWSGTDLMNSSESQKSVKKLKGALSKMKAINSACKGFEQLTHLVLAVDNLDIKGSAITNVYSPSLAAIEVHVAKNTAKAFKSCQFAAQKIIRVLQSALPAAVENYEGSMKLRALF